MLHRLFTAEFWEVLVGCWSALSMLGAYRMRRWLAEHLERERQLDIERTAQDFERHNETLRILSEASASTERPTLESLIGNEKADWSLESSVTPLDPSMPLDWSDDHETTATLPDTPVAKRSRPSKHP